MHFLPCNSCEQGTHTNAKETETLLVATVSHDQEPFQKSEYFLVLNLNWATAIFILQCNTPGLWESHRQMRRKKWGYQLTTFWYMLIGFYVIVAQEQVKQLFHKCTADFTNSLASASWHSSTDFKRALMIYISWQLFYIKKSPTKIHIYSFIYPNLTIMTKLKQLK